MLPREDTCLLVNPTRSSLSSGNPSMDATLTYLLSWQFSLLISFELLTIPSPTT
jgi:hypothetical protein